MEQYSSIQQLKKKEDGQNRKPIYPPTVIQAVFDAKTGASLEAILAQFNSIYIQYQGTPKDTRNIIPKEMRRQGLIISYVNIEGVTIEEQCINATQRTNENWGDDENWLNLSELHEKVLETTYVSMDKIIDAANAFMEKLNQGVAPEMLSESVKQMISEAGTAITNAPDEEDITTTGGELPVLKFKDKEYVPEMASGLGRQYLRKNIVAGVNVLTQSMLQWPNTIYIIQYDYDLQGAEITIPEGCVLNFQGGSLRNGTIVSNGIININSDDVCIFNKVILKGTINKPVNALWFGAKGDNKTDNTEVFNFLVEYYNNIYIPKGDYVTNSIIVKNTKTSFKFQGEINYDASVGNQCTKFIYIGTDSFIKFESALYVGEIGNFNVLLNQNALYGLRFNDMFDMRIENIGIFNTTTSIIPECTAICIEGIGYNNLFNRIIIKYVNKGFLLTSKGSSDWHNNIQLGTYKTSFAISSCNYGIEIQKGSMVSFVGVSLDTITKDGFIFNTENSSLNPLSVIIDKSYIENVKEATFKFLIEDKGYKGVNLFIQNTEFHNCNSNGMFVNNGRTCYVNILNCIGILFLSDYEKTLFVGDIIKDIEYKNVHSSESHLLYPYSKLNVKSSANDYYIIPKLSSAIHTLGAEAGLSSNPQYTTQKTSMIVKTVLLRNMYNYHRKTGGTLWIPLVLTDSIPRDNDKYIYNVKLYICRSTDSELSSTSDLVYRNKTSMIEFFVHYLGNDGYCEKEVKFGKSYYEEYNIQDINVLPGNGSNGERHLYLTFNNYIGNTVQDVDYSLLFIADIECIGRNVFAKAIPNYGNQTLMEERNNKRAYFDSFYSIQENKWYNKLNDGTGKWIDINYSF